MEGKAAGLGSKKWKKDTEEKMMIPHCGMTYVHDEAGYCQVGKNTAIY